VFNSCSHQECQEVSRPTRAGDAPLVLSSISQTRPVDRGLSGFLSYRNSLKILRSNPSSLNAYKADEKIENLDVLIATHLEGVNRKTRGAINSFSIKSKSRLQNLCLNAECDFISQLTLTYDKDQAPADGLALKTDLNKFLVRLRKEFPGVKYLWILEFQKNGNPHFHVFTTIKYTPGYARFLGYIWNVVVKGSIKHLKVHQYVPAHHYKRPLKPGDRHGSFCPWDMGDGSYLCYKYLSKSSQKSVPAHFSSVGRFWGATRSLVKPLKAIGTAEFYQLFEDTLNTETGEIITAQKHINRFFRDLRNFHEKRTWQARIKHYKSELTQANGRWTVRKPKRFKSPVRRGCDATINYGVMFYQKWFRHYQEGFQIPF